LKAHFNSLPELRLFAAILYWSDPRRTSGQGDL